MKDYFELEEFGAVWSEPWIVLKGKEKRAFGKEREIIRRMSIRQENLTNKINSALMLGSLTGNEVRCIGNVFELAENGVKEIRVKVLRDDSGHYFETSDLRLLKGGLLENVSPSDGLLCALVSKTIVDEVKIFCDKDLSQYSYDEYSNLVSSRRLKLARIKGLKIDTGIPNEEMERLEKVKNDFMKFDYGCPATAIDVFGIHHRIKYRNDSATIYAKLPERKIAYDKQRKGLKQIVQGLPLGKNQAPELPYLPNDAVTILHTIIEKAGIEVKFIYVYGKIEKNMITEFSSLDMVHREAGKMGLKNLTFDLFVPDEAVIVLKKDEKTIVTLAPSDYAITLSHLNSKELWIFDYNKL